MTKNGNNEFKGSTKEALRDIRDDMKDVQMRVSRMEKWMWLVTGGLIALSAGRLPDLVKIVLAQTP